MPRDQKLTTSQDPATSDDPLFREPDDQHGDQPLGGHGDPLRDPLDADDDDDRADTPIGDGITTGRHAGDEPSDTPGEWVAGNRGPDYVAGRDGSVVPGQAGEPAAERTDPDGDVTGDSVTGDRDPVSGDPAVTDTASDLRTTQDPEVAPDSAFSRGSGAPVDPNAPAPGTGHAGATSLSAATTESVGSATTPDPAAPETTAVPDTPAATASSGTTTGAPVPGAPGTGSTTGVQAASAPLVSHGSELHDDWARIQSAFVDDPRGSVSQAADLVSQVTSSLVSALQEREQTLRGSWDSQGDQGPDTENLRNALRDYRAFFEMLTKV
ncbi:MAG TPA: hypothetical protein VH089_20530 [Streptosporangiaceae bacterium]|nr:hypothetical protein [Streptosporangiaceae bacterium]